MPHQSLPLCLERACSSCRHKLGSKLDERQESGRLGYVGIWNLLASRAPVPGYQYIRPSETSLRITLHYQKLFLGMPKLLTKQAGWARVSQRDKLRKLICKHACEPARRCIKGPSKDTMNHSILIILTFAPAFDHYEDFYTCNRGGFLWLSNGCCHWNGFGRSHAHSVTRKSFNMIRRLPSPHVR